MLGKAFPYPSAGDRLELCPWISPDGAGVWSQQGLWDDAAPTVAAFRVCIPPCPGCRFARSLGPLSQVLALVAYADSIEPGSLGAEVVNIPRTLDVQMLRAGGQDGR